LVGGKNFEKVGFSKWQFPMGRYAKAALGSLQGTGDKNTFAGSTYIWEMSLDLVAYPREVSVDGLRVYIGGLESDIKG
jgi:hypothetical protein